MKLNFLLHHENTGYKLTDNIADLIYTQIHFLYICAKIQDDKLREIHEGTQNDSLPLDITASDSPEDVRDKFDIITECLI